MLNKTRYLLVLSVFFFSPTLFAKTQLLVAVGLAKPPYVLQNENSGYELDLVRNILEKMGKSTKFIYTQYGHSSKMLAVKEVDAVMTTNQSVFKDVSKLSDAYITYQNVAITLKISDITINSIDDIANYTVTSFQKADKLLGQAFANAVDKSPLYMKVADQSQQPKLLLKNRAQVLIMDKNIFTYFAKALGIENINERFTFHPIFPKTHYRMAFKNQEHVQLFNHSLAQYKLTEDYAKLREKYNL